MLSREKKEQQVLELADIVSREGSVVFTDFAGLTTSDMSELRIRLRENGVRYKVTKKSLWPFVQKRAHAALPTSADEKITFLGHKGSVGIAYSKDEGIAASKVLTEFAKDHENLTVLGALAEGEFLGLERIRALASLPSREELLGKVVYVLSAPMRNLVSVLGGPQRELVWVLSQIKDQK